MENNHKELMTPKEVAAEFGISYSTLARYRLRKNSSSLPYYRVFGRIAYKRSEILEWIDKGRGENCSAESSK